jgi:hypothetical protein
MSGIGVVPNLGGLPGLAYLSNPEYLAAMQAAHAQMLAKSKLPAYTGGATAGSYTPPPLQSAAAPLPVPPVRATMPGFQAMFSQESQASPYAGQTEMARALRADAPTGGV